MSAKQPSESLTAYLDGEVKSRIPKALNDAANALKDIIKTQLNTPGTGRKYRRVNASYSKPDKSGKRTKVDTAGNFHTASAPGASPAPDLTRLRESATSVRSGLLKWKVGVSAPGALALEKGTTTAGKKRTTTIAARPYMEPAKQSWQKTAGAKFTVTP